MPTSLRPFVLGAAVGALLAGCGGAETDPAPRARPLPPVAAQPAIDVGGTPVAVALGAGAVWVVDDARGTVTRLDARTGAPSGPAARIAGGPFDVAVGEGAAWVVGGDGGVAALDPRTGARTRTTARVVGANGIAAGAGGVWVTSRIAGTVTRVDPATGRAGVPIATGAGAADVAVVGDDVWVANAAAGTVSHVDAATGRAGAPIPVGADQVLALTADERGAWVARSSGLAGARVEVVRVDARSRRVRGEPQVVQGAVPLGLAVDAGSVWATDAAGGRLTRIDAATGAVSGTPIEVGGRPADVAAGAGAVWVVDGGGALTRLTPAG